MNLNLSIALIQLILCISLIYVLSSNFEKNTNLALISGDLNIDETTTIYKKYDQNLIFILLLIFTLCTSIFHFIYYFKLFNYNQRIEKGNNSLRWIEYSITATIIILVIALSCGTIELNTQILIISMTICTMLCGDIVEKAIKMNNLQIALTATFIGWILLLTVFSIIFKNFIYAAKGIQIPGCKEKIKPPAFVYYITIIMFVLYLSFGIIQILQLVSFINGRKIHYQHFENSYSITSVISKTFIVLMLYYGMFSRSQKIKC